MPNVIDREPIDNALKAMLATVTQRPGELLEAPAGARTPYFIVYPLDGGGFDGSMLFPDENAELPYQVTSVGSSPKQVQMMGDRVWRAILEREAWGGFKHAITIAGITICHRQPYAGRGSLDLERAGPEIEKVVVSLPQRFSLYATLG